ncbi:hypothetical protein [Methylovulum miyakonense]|uniref:hypothetical protein n=1 Tax=Methylovulum miyakonense TaxID=645578 RepID=UPI0003622EB7|nr:hypothetical protein [Methylovulum miyakonense]
MIALRQFKRVPNDHKIVIESPENIEENQLMEVILLCKESRQKDKAHKIEQLKNSQTDRIFLDDMQLINNDFRHLDNEATNATIFLY